MKRSDSRILTTHVGSLIRPKSLLDAGKAVAENPAKQRDYDTALRQSVADVVKQQVETGIDIVNDGEYGKGSWANYILDRVTGFEIRPNQLRPVYWLGRDRERFKEMMEIDMPGVLTGRPTEACVGDIKYKAQGVIARDMENLTAAVAAAKPHDVFFTAVAPASTAYDGVNEHYKNERDYVFAIAEALRVEYQAVHKAGFVLQVDDAVLANMYDHLVQQSPAKYREWA
ncbi:MAG: hypothetical protein ACREFC_08645, partial [Stellaceae bacterium]